MQCPGVASGWWKRVGVSSGAKGIGAVCFHQASRRTDESRVLGNLDARADADSEGVEHPGRALERDAEVFVALVA